MVAYLACESRGLFRLLLHPPREEPFFRQLKQEPKKSLLLSKGITFLGAYKTVKKG